MDLVLHDCILSQGYSEFVLIIQEVILHLLPDLWKPLAECLCLS